MKQHQSGLDLLRCVAFLFVVTFHFFLYNGYYYMPQTGVAMLFANSARWLSVSCIGIFLMLTGYLKSGEPLSRKYYRNLWPVLLGYLLAAAISIPIRHFLLGDVQTLSTWTNRLLGFGGVYYGWYVEMYVGLLLLSPIINLALDQLEGKRQFYWLAATLLIVSAFPGATKLTLFPDYWRAMYPLTYYALGAIIRRLQPKIRPWLAILGAFAVSLALGAVTLLSTDDILSEAFTQEFADLWIVLIAVCVFLALYRLHIYAFWQKLLRWAAGGCFGGYLLSHLLDAWMYRLIPAWRDPAQYWKAFFCITVPIYLISIVMGRILMWIVGGVLKCMRRCRISLKKRRSID